jgi:hypothetical protein
MKRYLILLFALAISLTSYGQIDETNNIVRNNTLSPARVANALDIMKVFTTSGTDTYAISVTVGSHSPYAGGLTYTTGDIFKIKIGNTNTSGTTSLNVNTDGAIPLKDAEGNNFGIGDLAANSIHAFYYDGTNFREISGSGGGSGTPGGSDTYVQYNDASAFGGEADFTYDETTNTLTVDNAAVDTEAYDATGWNGDLTVPTKDATRDEMELKAPLASPTFTGTPAAPTAATSTNTTQLATTAFVQQEIAANGIAYTPVDELTEIAGVSLETDITAADLLQALGIITYVPIHADAATGITLTNQASTVQSLGNGASFNYMRLDTQLIRQMRLSARVVTVSASANNPRLFIQYSLDNGSNYTTLGAGTIASGDAISMFTGASGVQNTNWVTLPSEAKDLDLVWRIAQHGGDGAADPVVGNVFIQCKY